MAQHHDHHGTMVPQDTNFDNADQPGIAQPYSQTEVEELLYGEDRSASERLARLREMREEAAIRESGDWGDQDPAALLDELDRAIDELSATIANSDDNEAYAGLGTSFDNDPADRLDARGRLLRGRGRPRRGKLGRRRGVSHGPRFTVRATLQIPERPHGEPVEPRGRASGGLGATTSSFDKLRMRSTASHSVPKS